MATKNAPPLDWTINVAFRVLTRKKITRTNVLTKKNATSHDRTINAASGPYTPTGTIFELIQDINGTHLLIKLHGDQTINAASKENTWKNAPPLSAMFFQPTRTIFDFVPDIIGTNLLNKFHKDRTINVASKLLTRQMLTPHDAQGTKDDHKSSP
ncbi:hypothetical protein DPMN_016072 [Dreissena polymorpha]|uniref:Uncharacterized protein n=1 Tax=Dreissena polymorpha TaxID=45954 RepID=A0A9D4S6T4_DREPO|nr:hypothetical protein DPMN_016072 [Dreissena polymorpha]